MATRQPKLDERTRQERLRESKRKHEERKRRAAGIPPIGSPMQCERCPAKVPKTNSFQRYCSACKKLVKAERRRVANEKYSQTHGRFKEAPEKLRERNRQYVARHPERRRESYLKYQRYKARTDAAYRLNLRISHAIWMSLKGRKAGQPWEELVGYSLADLSRHIERQFVDGMSWSNMGEWHVDHVIPKKNFVFEDSGDEEFIACWALSNLRPLKSIENFSKGGKRLFLL